MDIERRVNDERRISIGDVTGTLVGRPRLIKGVKSSIPIYEMSNGIYAENARKSTRRKQADILYDIKVESGTTFSDTEDTWPLEAGGELQLTPEQLAAVNAPVDPINPPEFAPDAPEPPASTETT